jgi:hypothetical protein
MSQKYQQETCERSQAILDVDVHLDRPSRALIHPVCAFTGEDKVIVPHISRTRDVGDPSTPDRNVAATPSGHTRKNSAGANVFRVTLKNGHRPIQSACLKRAMNRQWPATNTLPTSVT